jgi:hypothetical protein
MLLYHLSWIRTATSQAPVNDELRSGVGFKQIRPPCRREQGLGVTALRRSLLALKSRVRSRR